MNAPLGPGDSAVQGLLREAYTAVSNGDPTQALRLVLTALQATGGEAAAAPALNRVITQLIANNQRNALQELTELFARAASLGGEESTLQVPGPMGPPPATAAAWGPTTLRDSMSCSGDEPTGGIGSGRGGSVEGVQEATSAWTGSGAQGPGYNQAPILSETGREGFMECALQDGSSYLCSRCQGVVLISRRQQHDQYWCQGSGGA
ncbi:hypothetical protein Vretimale_5808 [Volvox reticuliferus]|uniref:C2HC zinc finger plants domain-containing protein n=1 Tax=Volvox reticuliferus TaxID=1737510 RepID=A0A8J4G685_9CHLO|nr:hypothetical protein Vretifemale_5703 [Volvox reticuliferus]GIM00906.1 hypothetical protein Vretimale_5808 [Volvox reticuliferus]